MSEEDFDKQGFHHAMKLLSTVDILAAIQKAAHKFMATDISICFSKLSINAYMFYVVIPPGVTSSSSAMEVFGKTLSGILDDYDAITYIPNSSFSETEHFSLMRISPDNHQTICEALKKYSNYLEKMHLQRKNSDATYYERLGLMSHTTSKPYKKAKSEPLLNTCPSDTAPPKP